jgi:hypothetical protein
VKRLDFAIPCDAQCCLALQQFLRLRGGYPGIAPEDWPGFDRLRAAWHPRRRDVAAPRAKVIAPSASLDTCVSCNQQAPCRYRSATTGELYWYCADHRLAQWWADTRRWGRS